MALGHKGFIERLRVHGKAMVLRRNLDPARLITHHRLIPAAVPKLQFVGLPPKRMPENLMPQTNPENRHLLLNQALHHRIDIGQGPRIARAIRQKIPHPACAGALLPARLSPARP